MKQFLINVPSEKGFTVTTGAFFGRAEGSRYSLTLSDLGTINGTMEESVDSQNMDAGLICDGEF